MNKIIFTGLLLLVCSFVPLYAQTTDSIRSVEFQEISVTASRKAEHAVLATQSAEQVSSDEMHLRAGHSLMSTLSHTPGVQSMDIGVGFSKPMIRGLGFQRIAVAENNVKQEGQQWGADHGLEIDANNVDGVRIVKGPASVLYGSDAMGGVIEILPPAIPRNDTLGAEIALRCQTVNIGLGGTAMCYLKRGHWYARLRYSERHWADYSVPADSFTYLSMRLPIRKRRLQNTAGLERSGNALLVYQRGGYRSELTLSDTYQKAGFFSGAHGIPNAAQLDSAGCRWDIALPFSSVNHLKVTSCNRRTHGFTQTTLTLGYQLNHREEWSRFHTHVLGQQPPAVDPDKELMLHLHTASANLQMRFTPSTEWEHYAGVSAMYQHNSIGGYSFLIPAYRRAEAGAYYLVNWLPLPCWTFSAALRYDYGYIHSQPHDSTVQEIRRHLHNYSLAAGAEYKTLRHQLQIHIGRAFRMPSVNELASNGVHHGAFRHERGDNSLPSEQGWQADVSYRYTHERVEVSVSPFVSYYTHYIYLRPTGLWSDLPDAGQIYRYTDSPALFAGGELRTKVRLVAQLYYTLLGEYVHTYNLQSHTALPFSPPASMHNSIGWEDRLWRLEIECQTVAPQRHIAHNEDPTPGYTLLHAVASVDIPLPKGKMSIVLQGNNLLNKAYLNHLSFYRKIELPEAGIDIQTTIRFTF